jgi:hypothetical protein
MRYSSMADGLYFVGAVTKLGSEDAISVLTPQFLGLLPLFFSTGTETSVRSLEACCGTDSILAIVPDVVEEDKRTVGPAGEHWMIGVERLDDRVDVVGPLPGVVVTVARLVRKTMTSHIQRD